MIDITKQPELTVAQKHTLSWHEEESFTINPLCTSKPKICTFTWEKSYLTNGLFN